MPLLTTTHLGRDLNFPGQPVDDPRLIDVRELRLGILRRHLAVADHVEDLQPPLDVLPLEHVRIQGVDAEFALLFSRPVAANAHAL